MQASQVLPAAHPAPLWDAGGLPFKWFIQQHLAEARIELRAREIERKNRPRAKIELTTR